MAEMFKVTFQNVSNKLLNCGNIKKKKKKKDDYYWLLFIVFLALYIFQFCDCNYGHGSLAFGYCLYHMVKCLHSRKYIWLRKTGIIELSFNMDI